MESPTLEERMTAMEKELTHLKQQLVADKPQITPPWWEQRFGAFADSEEYEEAARLGREHRESLRPKGDEEAA